MQTSTATIPQSTNKAPLAIQKVNKVYKQVFQPGPRYIILMGGRSAGRSMVASQYAVSKLRAPEYFRCAIMRLVLGDIRNSIFQEIDDRIEEGQYHDVNVREHLLSFQCGHNTINGIGFKKSSGDQKSKLKSLANYNCVIIEEADEIGQEDFTQLDDSLRKVGVDITVFLLLNAPPKNHWIIKRWFNLEDHPDVEGFYIPTLKESMKHDTLFIHTTYRDNIQNVNDTTVQNFLRYKETNPDHYYNMIEGYVSHGARGRIFKNWKTCTDEVFDSLPFESYYGLDFGFTNDPTALIEIKEHNEKIWFRELLYERGLTNPLISKRMKQLGLDQRSAVIYADSAEPKSIQELRDEGWTVIESEKGADSVRAGVDMLLSKEVFYTEGSENLAIENQEYKWALDKNKEPTNEPIDDFNHLMDAGRYGVWTRSRVPFIGFA